MKPVDVKDNTYIDFLKKSMIKILNLKLVNIKIFLLNGICQIDQKKYSLLVKLKILCHGHMLLMVLVVKRLLVRFMKMNCTRLSKMNLG